MGRWLAIIGAVGAFAAVFAWNYYFKERREVTPAAAPIALPEPVVPAEPQPEPAPRLKPEAPPVFVENPAEPEPDPVELPPLDESDAPVREALADGLGVDSLAGLLADQSVIRKLVVTIDNLPADRVSMKVRAIGPAPERLAVVGQGDDLALSERNFKRYDALMQRLGSTDPEQAADLYVLGYPLLQQAYAELGYPDRQFHGRLLEVIDHLLDTPAPDGPLALTRPHVLYEFEDQQLEALSAGQKMLLRVGPDHRASVTEWLNRFREAIESREIS